MTNPIVARARSDYESVSWAMTDNQIALEIRQFVAELDSRAAQRAWTQPERDEARGVLSTVAERIEKGLEWEPHRAIWGDAQVLECDCSVGKDHLVSETRIPFEYPGRKSRGSQP
jgi:hypothetical protein